MKPSQRQLDRLAVDADFNERVSTDKALLEAYNSKDLDAEEQRNELLAFLGGTASLGGFDLPLLTPGAAAVLSTAGNKIVNGGKPTIKDLDAFIFVCANGRDSLFELEELDKKAEGTIKAIGLEPGRVATIVAEMMGLAFAAFSYVPESAKAPSGQIVSFDSYWLARLVSIVHAHTGKDIEEILWEMPLATCNWFVLHDLEYNGMKGIKRRNRASEVMRRLDELIFEQLATWGEVPNG